MDQFLTFRRRVYSMIENSPNSSAYDYVFVGLNHFKFGTKTHCVVLYAISKFGAN